MKCSVVKDLLALYVDDACSDETKADIQEHLNSCEKCSKELENYKKEIIIKKKNYKENEDIKPFKKIKKRQRILIIILAVLALAFVVFQVNFKFKHMEYLDISYIKTYFKVKKQNEFLLNGDIHEFVETLACKDKKIKIKSQDKEDTSEKYITIDLEEFYKNYIKGKKIDYVNYDVTPKYEGTKIRCAFVSMKVEGIGRISTFYSWDKNQKVEFSIHPESGKDKKLNLLTQTLNLYTRDIKDEYYKELKFDTNSDFYTYIYVKNGNYAKLYDNIS